ncbi:uncharacterized protein At5g39865-like [Rutidosis leptorrhynchoides]|uniref:uncharacterized protein At5g39865-like n=1 Tax=Rutidosis leptorrhynchoides TaxID=125765 RepID=UPI003A9A3EE1
MGCASSQLLKLNHDQDFTTSALSHHFVSLTSTTYGLLTLDPKSSSTKNRTTLLSIFGAEPEAEIYSLLAPNPNSLSSKNKTTLQQILGSEPQPEVINSWELMAGLDSTAESFRLYTKSFQPIQEKSDLDHKDPIFFKSLPPKAFSLDKFENLCPPKGENKVVVYTTTLRGVRKTFEACNAVRAILEGYGVFVCERDISMDQGFREELRELMKGKDSTELVPPRVFVKGRYIGGADVVLKTMEDGSFCQLLEGLPKSKGGHVCEGCGGVRFLPCFKCNGSCKMVVDLKEEGGAKWRNRVVVRCGDCNENGLVHCPICIL